MDFKTHLETAWKYTLQYIVPLIVMTLAMDLVGICTIGILLPVMMAGYTRSILMMIRSGREPKIQDLFSEMSLFLPLLVFGLAVAVAVFIGFSLLFLPGIVVVCGVTFVCLYMMPLMTDRNFGLVEAIRESFRMVSGEDGLDHVIVAILFAGISGIGGLVFIGQPLATIFLMLAYEEKSRGVPPSPPSPPKPEEDVTAQPMPEEPEDDIVIKYKP